jgi:hypothetical protein
MSVDVTTIRESAEKSSRGIHKKRAIHWNRPFCFDGFVE